jgi:PspA associated protein B
MSFFSRLWKRSSNTSKKIEADFDAINSLSSAYIALETKLSLKSTGRTAVCIKRTNIPQFNEMKQEIEKFLEASKANFELTFRTVVDPYDYLWIIILSKTIEDNVAAITSIGDTIEEKGFSDRLLASVLELNNGTTNEYLIYNYKLDKFYPFVPINEQQKRRNHGEELKIMSALADEKKLPFEKEMSCWYPIWNTPVKL